MGADDIPGDGQAQAGTAAGPAFERAEHAFPLVRRNSRPVIIDGHQHRPPLRDRPQRHMLGMAPSVIDKGVPTSRLLAQGLVAKFLDHLPL